MSHGVVTQFVGECPAGFTKQLGVFGDSFICLPTLPAGEPITLPTNSDISGGINVNDRGETSLQAFRRLIEERDAVANKEPVVLDELSVTAPPPQSGGTGVSLSTVLLFVTGGAVLFFALK